MSQRDKFMKCLCRCAHYHMHYTIRDKSPTYIQMWNSIQSFAGDMENSAGASRFLDLVYGAYLSEIKGTQGRSEAISLLVQTYLPAKTVACMTEEARIGLIGNALSQAVRLYMRVINRSSNTLFFDGGLDIDRTTARFTESLEQCLNVESDRYLDPTTEMIPVRRYKSLMQKHQALMADHTELKRKYDKLLKKKGKKKSTSPCPIDEFLSE